MPERTTVIESNDPPAPAAPSDRTIDMAVAFGRMEAEQRTTQNEVAEVKAGQSALSSMMNSISETLQRLESRTNQAEERAEVAQVTAAAAIVEATANEENAEDQSGVLQVTPPMETKIQIEQRPATGKRWWQKAIFGP